MRARYGGRMSKVWSYRLQSMPFATSNLGVRLTNAELRCQATIDDRLERKSSQAVPKMHEVQHRTPFGFIRRRHI